jgi:putative ABC transport system permease protein
MRRSPARRPEFSLSRIRTSPDEEVAAEFAFHLEMTMKDLIRRGMNEADARAEAQRRFGNSAGVDAACRRLARERDQRRSRSEYWHELRQDVSFALRQLGRARLFTCIAICTLALGIGATACVFSVLNAVVLQPLPFPHPERIVAIAPTKQGTEIGAGSGAQLSAMIGLSQIFDAVAATIDGFGFTIVHDNEPVVIGGGKVTSGFLHVYGVSPILGRGFLPSDDQPGAPHVVVLSHRMWRRDFAGDSAVLGRSIRLNGEVYAVIGVMPSSFDILRNGDDLWVPLQLTTAQLGEYGSGYLALIARLRSGVSVNQATAAAHVAEHRLELANPVVGGGHSVNLHEFREQLVDNYRGRLFVLLGAVGFVLLIACVNVANLLLARGTVRARELAIRAALGAGRGRLVRQLLVESVVLTLAGAALGIGVAFALLKGFVAIAPDGLPRLDQAGINGMVLAFVLSIAVATSVLVGLLPAVRGAGSALQANLREGGRWSSGGGDRLRTSLVAAEVALAMTLLTGSGLLIRSAWSAQHVDPGFTAHNVFAARLLLPGTRYPDSAEVLNAYRRIDDAVSHIPGVASTALVSVAPLSNEGHMNTSVDVEGSSRPDGERPSAAFRLTSPNYFATLGIPILGGRDIRVTDAAGAPLVALVSKSLAAKLWPGESPVGKRIDALSFHPGPNLMEIIGVVGDLHDVSLTRPAEPTLYLPYAQTPVELWPAIQRSLVVVARTSADVGTMRKAIHRGVMSVDPSLPFASSHTMDEFLAASLMTERFNTFLLSTLGVIALLLATVGIYGVVSYFVSQRTREIGVRVALGALPTHIWRLVLGRGLAPIAFGALIGAGLSLATARLLREQLFGVAPTDPLTLGGVVGLLGIVALLATLLPARRAMRVAPIVALQES